MKFPALFLAQISETIQAVDHAAAAGDRWLMIASLVVIIGGGSLVIKWLVANIASKDAAHASERGEMRKEAAEERTEARAQRIEDQARYIESMNNRDKVISELSKEVAANTKTLTDHDRAMRAAHEVEIRGFIGNELSRRGITLPS